jgi:hypothetical protein
MIGGKPMIRLRHFSVWFLAVVLLASSGMAQDRFRGGVWRDRTYVQSHQRAERDHWKNWPPRSNVSPRTRKLESTPAYSNQFTPDGDVDPALDWLRERSLESLQRNRQIANESRRLSTERANARLPADNRTRPTAQLSKESRLVQEFRARLRKPQPQRTAIHFRDQDSTATPSPQLPWTSSGVNWFVSGYGERGNVDRGVNWGVGSSERD